MATETLAIQLYLKQFLGRRRRCFLAEKNCANGTWFRCLLQFDIAGNNSNHLGTNFPRSFNASFNTWCTVHLVEILGQNSINISGPFLFILTKK